MAEIQDIQWGLRRLDNVVEIMASERLARREAVREGGAVIYRRGATPWRPAAARSDTAA